MGADNCIRENPLPSAIILMQFEATAKYIRTSTRKVRLVADSIRKLHPGEAITALAHVASHAAVPMRSVIASALANAKAKQADTNQLRFQTIEVMGGPVMKRWRAVSRGQAHAYKKRMTHIRVVLTDEGGKRV